MKTINQLYIKLRELNKRRAACYTEMLHHIHGPNWKSYVAKHQELSSKIHIVSQQINNLEHGKPINGYADTDTYSLINAN